jgi:dipeptidase
VLAEPQEAWALETAGRFWVAEKVRSRRSLSNVLSIGKEFDRIGEGTLAYAKSARCVIE